MLIQEKKNLFSFHFSLVPVEREREMERNLSAHKIHYSEFILQKQSQKKISQENILFKAFVKIIIFSIHSFNPKHNGQIDSLATRK